MPRIDVLVEAPIHRTSRVMQIEGMFDIAADKISRREWTADLPIEAHPWHVGLIVGRSGSGKSTIARKLFGEAMVDGFEWSPDRAFVDDFPTKMPLQELSGILSSVGFSSPKSWLRPYRCLSNGEQFRVTVARALVERRELAVIDEFTSVVDRTVAQIGSAAVAKSVRRGGGKFVAVTCHFDVIDWLDPDWIFEPETGRFQWRLERRRPPIEIVMERVHRRAWSIFREHHYLSHEIGRCAACFVAFVSGQPAAFASALMFPHAINPAMREHRTVCLPDYQGVGIGQALGDLVASLYSPERRYISTTSHPAMIASRKRSANWRLARAPSMVSKARQMEDGRKAKSGTSFGRITAGFEYVGPAASAEVRAALLTERPDRFIPSDGAEAVIAKLRRYRGVTVGFLCRETGLSSSFVARVLDELRTMGCVERIRDNLPRRQQAWQFLGEPLLRPGEFRSSQIVVAGNSTGASKNPCRPVQATAGETKRTFSRTQQNGPAAKGSVPTGLKRPSAGITSTRSATATTAPASINSGN